MLRTIPLLLVLAACKGDTDELIETIDTGTRCTDADEDGVCVQEGDCDDSDPLVYPGGPDALGDVPYNGKDDDCDGTDLCDLDGDGYAKILAEAPNCAFDPETQPLEPTDCNDGNPLVYPGAEEPCYPDYDWNCDGIVSEDDCDLDGWPRQDDCQDEDPDIYPGAPEAWYDGVDSDCGYDSDFDKDLDSDELEWQEGWPDPAWPDKIPVWDPFFEDELRVHYIDVPQNEDEWIENAGEDCDDEDPLTGGGLKELWDGQDRDCDDVIDLLTVRDSWRDYNASGGVGDGKWGSHVVNLGDIDGDDYAEFAASDLGGGGPDGYDGRVYIVPTADDTASKPSDVALTTIDVSSSNVGGFWLMGWGMDKVGDLDKDRKDELLVGIPMPYEASGTVAVFSGEDLEAGGNLDESDANTLLTSIGYLGGMEVAGLGDLNGDRLPEVATNGSYFSVMATYIFSGVRVGNGGTLIGAGEDSNALISIVDEEATYGGGPVISGEFTGDGVDDIVVASWAPAAVTGSTDVGFIFAWDGDALVELGYTTPALADVTLTGDSCPGASLGVVEDMDGDGYEELTIGDPCVNYAAVDDLGGAVYVVDGDDLMGGVGSDLTELAHVTFEAPFAGACMRTSRRFGDHDGDGTPDLMVGAPGSIDVYGYLQGWWGAASRGHMYWFPADTVARGGTFLVTDSAATFESTNEGSGFGMSWDPGELNMGEDSTVDLAVAQPLLGQGKVYLFLNQL